MNLRLFLKLSLGLILTSAAFSSVLAADIDDIEKPKETDNKPVPEPTAKPVEPVVPVTPIPDPVPQRAEGVLEFGARVVSNMENGFHIMDHGYKAQCVDGQGVVAQARMDIYAVANGELADSVNGGGYTPVKLRPTLEYLREGASTGSCNFTVCLPASGSSLGKEFSCDPRPSQSGRDGDRPVELKLSNVSYSAAGKDIQVKTNYPLVSGFHPVFGFAAAEKSFKDYQSPLVINMNKSGPLNLVDVWDSSREIRFDLVADGSPVRTGWIGKDAAFLALDRNSNGKIDSGLELFGEYTDGALANAEGRRWGNGFLALAQYDKNKDGVIDVKDPEYTKLVVWQDKNLDGVSQRSEMKSLRDAKIVSMSLAFTENLSQGKPVNVAGNEVRLISSVTMKDGSKHTFADVWFNQRRFAERPVASVKK